MSRDELHGGAVEVESSVGKGSTFRVTLPVDCREMPVRGVTIGAGSPEAM